MQRPSLVVPIAIAAFALIGLVTINTIAQKNRPKTQTELIAEAQAELDRKQVENGMQAAPEVMTKAAAALRSGDVNPSEMGPEFTLPGKEGSDGPEVVVGYEWTPDLQGDPTRLKKLARQLQDLVPQARLRFVNTDVRSDVRPGISVKGRLVVPPDGEGNIDDTRLQPVAAAIGIGKAK